MITLHLHRYSVSRVRFARLGQKKKKIHFRHCRQIPPGEAKRWKGITLRNRQIHGLSSYLKQFHGVEVLRLRLATYRLFTTWEWIIQPRIIALPSTPCVVALLRLLPLLSTSFCCRCRPTFFCCCCRPTSSCSCSSLCFLLCLFLLPFGRPRFFFVVRSNCWTRW